MTLFLVCESENANGIFEYCFLVISFENDTQKKSVRESENDPLSRVRERECQWYIRISVSGALFGVGESENDS